MKMRQQIRATAVAAARVICTDRFMTACGA